MQDLPNGGGGGGAPLQALAPGRWRPSPLNLVDFGTMMSSY